MSLCRFLITVVITHWSLLAVAVECLILLAVWRRGIVVSGVRRVNEVNLRRAWLVLGWVAVFGWVYHLGM